MAASFLARRLFVARADIPLQSLSRRLRPSFSSSAATTNLTATVAPSAAASSNSNAGAGNTSNRSIKPSTALAIASASLLGGYCLGTSHSVHWDDLQKNRELPKGERGCCSCDTSASSTDNNNNGATSKTIPELTEAQIALSSKLQKIVGKEHVYDGMTDSSHSAPFLTGARLGSGKALCIVQPRTVREAVKCLQEIVDAGCVVLPQGSNTGLTGG